MSESHLPWVVELKVANLPQPLKAQFEKKLVIGRFDKAAKTLPDIDLTPYNAEIYGISRQHAALIAEEEQLMVVDLNSGNGTYLNGTKLTPKQPMPLRSKDRLQLAKLPVQVRVVVAPSYAVGFYDDVSLQMSDTVLPGAGQTVLIVKNDEAVTQVLVDAFTRCGYRTIVAHSVVAAIRVFNQKRPDAILLDNLLPDMPGMELCRYVRRDTHQNTTPLILLTSEKSPTFVSEALDAGADVVLAEPLSIKELQHVVTMLMGGSEPGSAAFHTKHLVGTAPLQAIQPQTRRNSIVVFAAGSKEPMVLTINQPLTLGRSVSQDLQSHVDLTRNNAVDNGVSRVHARLFYEVGKFYVEDMNSVNGTYVNGEPLQPGDKTHLNSADELRLGRLRLYVYFLEDADKSE